VLIPALVGMAGILAYVAGNEHTANVPEPQADSDDARSRGATQKIDWATLRQLDFRSNTVPELLRRLDSRKVAIPGFVVPLEDNAGYTSEFLLVPWFGACIHSPPPPPNQMVLVKMSGGRSIQPPSSPIWMHGVLWLTAGQSPYGKASYQMSGSHIELLRE
jgi:hypothetical protein